MEYIKAHKALLTINSIGSNKTARNKSEGLTASYNDNVDFIVNNFVDIYLGVFSEQIKQIKSSYPDGFVRYEQALKDDTTQVPMISTNISVGEIEFNLAQVSVAERTVFGMLERLEPVLYAWNSFYKKSEELHRSLFLAEQAWKADGAFHVFMDQSIVAKIEDLNRVVQRLRIRKESLEACRTALSRIISLRQATPNSG